MTAYIRHICLLLSLVSLVITNVESVEAAADDAPTFILRPHCAEGYKGDAWIFGGIAPPGWNSAEDSNLCPSFDIEDPQTLRTSILNIGDTLDMDLVVQNPGSAPISTVRAWLNYDSSVLEGDSITINTENFQETVPGEADFSAKEGYVKIHASTPGKDASTRYFVHVARITLTAKEAIAPGSIVNFFDIQRDGHTSILSKGETGKEKYVLGQDPGSLLVRIAQDVQEPEEDTEDQNASAICTNNDECESGVCTNGACTEAELLADGEWCTTNEQCLSSLCTAGICSQKDDSTTANNTMECSEDVECPIGTNCTDGRCQEPKGNVPIGGICVLSSQCNSNLCVEGVCKDPVTHTNDRTAFSLLQLRNVRVTSEGNTAFLQWDDLRSSSLKTYNVYYGTTSGEYIQRKVIPGSTPSVSIRNLPEGITYYFAVRAADTKDEESAFSQEVAVEIGNPSTSTAPLVASLFTDAPGENPIGDSAMHAPGETGASSVLALLLILSAAIGTFFASRRQMVATHK